MLKRPFRVYALSLAGGALLLGGATVAAGAMTLPGSLPGGVTEQSTAAIVAYGNATAKVEQHGWQAAAGTAAAGTAAAGTAAAGTAGGWHGGGWHGGGWHGDGGGWRGGRWCYWHPYACRGW